MSSRPAARLVPLLRTGLPAWCDPYLADLGSGDLFDSRLWYDTILAHALPQGTQPMLATTETVLLPLRRDGGRLRSLVTDYSVVWRPLAAPGAGEADLRLAGQALGRLLRFAPPVILDALDAQARGLAPLLDGFRQARLLPMRFAAFGNWHESLPPGAGWEGFLASRPAALRNTVARKMARATKGFEFECHRRPGPALEEGIRAYVAVRAASWKPHEPFPDFDAALLRPLAAAGALRLGVLRDRADGRPVAAQYWAIDHAGPGMPRRATVLKLAHAEEARAASPGTVLTAMMIRRLIEEDGVASLDFGRGDDAYKQLWVARRRQRIGLVLADPLHPHGLAALARQAGGGAWRGLRAWAGRTGGPAQRLQRGP
jgi:hypothetical protein